MTTSAKTTDVKVHDIAYLLFYILVNLFGARLVCRLTTLLTSDPQDHLKHISGRSHFRRQAIPEFPVSFLELDFPPPGSVPKY